MSAHPSPRRPGRRPPPPVRGRTARVDPVLVEAAVAIVWLAVGSLGIGNDGLGTLLLAVGIAAVAWIVVENRRAGPRVLDPPRSASALRLGGGAVALVIVASILLGLVGGSAFLPGLSAVVTGGAFVLLARSTGQRPTLWLGWAVAGLGVIAAFLSTQQAAGFASQGLLGLVVGVLVLLSAADRVGLVEMLRDRAR